MRKYVKQGIKPKKCIECNKEYQPVHNKQAYCDDCRVRSDHGKGNTQYNWCSCKRNRKQVRSSKCWQCNAESLGKIASAPRDPMQERVVRNVCKCGKRKIDTAPYCGMCVVKRAMDNRMRIAPREPIMARKSIERIKCKCGSGEYAPRGHQCRICYALDIGAPAPSNDSALWLTATGAKI